MLILILNSLMDYESVDNNDVFFSSPCPNSYVDDNATHLWRYAYNVKNLCRCRQLWTGPNGFLNFSDVTANFVLYCMHKQFRFQGPFTLDDSDTDFWRC